MTSTGQPQAWSLRLVERAALAIVFASAVVGTQLAQAQAHNVLHSFAGGSDGAAPYAALVLDTAGNLYGTTTAGGTSNLGTVFKLDASGKETVLHSFAGGSDGAAPYAGLALDASGNLYGTTSVGGASNFGTVFKLDAAGNETVLYSFAGGTDGATPHAALVLDPSSILYGTTTAGGSSNSGIVFKLDTTGTETVLYAFTGGADGKSPSGDLVLDAAGNLYGTTFHGGKMACFLGYDTCGVVFKLDTAGKETVLHTFTGGTDGGNPQAGLVREGAGNLYGSTSDDGGSSFAVVFKLDTTGKETVLYSFGNVGAEPFGGLILDAAGNLYGTNSNGGALAFGSVFELDTTGKQTVLYSFTGGADGSAPYASLVFDSVGNLYGTTTAGGGPNFGTVFAITPDFSLSASGLTPSIVSPGGSSSSTLNMAALSAFSGSVALTCAVTPTRTLTPTCSISPASITSGTPATLTVNTTGAAASTLHSGSGLELLHALWLPLIGVVAGVSFGSDQKRKRRTPVVILACMLFAGLVFQAACGGSSNATGGGNGGTSAGTYTVTVTGSSGSLKHSTTAMLTVQ